MRPTPEFQLSKLPEPIVPAHGREVCFNAAFPVINAVVYDILDDHSLSRPASREETSGATHYRVWLDGARVTLSLKVLYRGDERTSLRIQAYPSPAGVVHSPDDEAWLNHLMAAIHLEVNRVIRLSDPKYTIEPTMQTPPPPHWSEGIEKLLAWRHLFAKDLSDKELAKEGGVSYSRFRKVLSQSTLQRPGRGRPRKEP